jgi:hypothetical protein
LQGTDILITFDRADFACGYKIQVSCDGGTNWVDKNFAGTDVPRPTIDGNFGPGMYLSTTTYTTEPCTDCAPVSATTYQVRLVASNNHATSTTSTNTITVNAASAPDPPTTFGATANPSSTPDSSTIGLTWSAPHTGCAAVTGYKIDMKIGTNAYSEVVANTASTTTSYQKTGLTNGLVYHFKIYAINSVGASTAFLESSSGTTPDLVPSPPVSVAGVAGNTNITVTWVAGVASGGSAITGYKIEQSSDSGSTWTEAVADTGDTLTNTVTGLANGTPYVFRITAINAKGTGDASNPSSATTPVTVPDSPTNPSATGGHLKAVVTWVAPSVNGGSAITGYKIEQSVDAGSAWTDAVADTGDTLVTNTVTGLTNGQAIIFRISTITAVGTSASPSASSGSVVSVTFVVFTTVYLFFS